MSGAAARRKVEAADEESAVLLHFAGHSFEPLLSGALFWRAERMLLVADLHLEKFSSYARRGEFLPPYDTGLTLKKLERDIEATGAERVVALGDSFHRDHSVDTLLDADRLRLTSLLDRSQWTWLSGNHDPASHRLGGHCLPHLEHRGLHLTHIPRRGHRGPGGGLVGGHLHPAATVSVDGRSVRRRCFVHDGATLVLPAYGAGTGSMNILSRPFAGLFDSAKLQVTMLGRDRLYPVSTKRLVNGI